MSKPKTLEEQVLHDFYEGKTVMQLVNDYLNVYESSKQAAIEKIYSILKEGSLTY